MKETGYDMRLRTERAKEFWPQVEKDFAEWGYRLHPGQQSVYQNRQTKLLCDCPCGNTVSKAHNQLRDGIKGCLACAPIKRGKIQATPIEDIRKSFADAGCLLVSDVYHNFKQKLDWVCRCGRRSDVGEINKVAFASFSQGKCCYFCGRQKANQRHPDKIAVTCVECSAEFKATAARAPTAKFCSHVCQIKNQTIPLVKIRCEICNNQFSVREDKAANARYCSRECQRDGSRLPWSQVEQLFQERGYILHPGQRDTFKSVLRTKLLCDCPNCGNPHQRTYNSLAQRDRKGCAKCCHLLAATSRTGEDHSKLAFDGKKRRKLRNRMRKKLCHALQRLRRKTPDKKSDLLGNKSINEIDAEHGVGCWHVDHIFPVIAFIQHDIFDQDAINHPTNLQVLPAKVNMQKTGRYDRAKFLVYLREQHGIVAGEPILTDLPCIVDRSVMSQEKIAAQP